MGPNEELSVERGRGVGVHWTRYLGMNFYRWLHMDYHQLDYSAWYLVLLGNMQEFFCQKILGKS